MFCEKCGTFLENDTKFCVNCGAKVVLPEPAPAPAPTPVAEQPAPAPAPAPVAEQPAPAPAPAPTPVAEQPAYAPQPAAQPVSQVFPKPAKPKKPRKKISKTAIIISIVAVILAIAVAVSAAIILPIINAVKIKDYVEVTIDEEKLVDGYIEAYVSIDTKQIRKDKDPDIGRDDYQEEMYEALSFCDLEVKSNDDELEGTAATGRYITGLSQDDTITVTLSWSDNEDDLEDIEDCEDELGFKFNKDEVKLEFKVSELLKKQKLEVLDTVEFDFLDALSKTVVESGYGDDINVDFSDIEETEIEGTEYTYEYDSYYGEVTIYDEEDYEVESFYVYWSDDEHTDYALSGIDYYDFSKGDEIEITLDVEDEQIGETHVFFKDTSYTHTVSGYDVVTLETAKSNAQDLKNDLFELAKEDAYSEMDSVHKLVYITPDSTSSYENIIVIFTKGTDDEGSYITPTIFYDVCYDNNSEIWCYGPYERADFDTYKEAYEAIEESFGTDYTYTEIN